jgi:hypothetical protein
MLQKLSKHPGGRMSEHAVHIEASGPKKTSKREFTPVCKCGWRGTPSKRVLPAIDEARQHSGETQTLEVRDA